EKFDNSADRTGARPNPTAMAYSDGVFYDPEDQLFKMWYMGGYSGVTCYAFSEDGISWHRPTLDVVSGTNVVLNLFRDSSTVWLDLVERQRDARYKMAVSKDGVLHLFTSPDGTHWRAQGKSGPVGDRTTFFYNPFRKKWA